MPIVRSDDDAHEREFSSCCCDQGQNNRKQQNDQPEQPHPDAGANFLSAISRLTQLRNMGA